MKLTDKIKRAFNRTKETNTPKGTRKEIGLEDLQNYTYTIGGINLKDVANSPDYSETIYFICLKHLSETLSKMSWEKRKNTKEQGREKIFDNELDLLLNVKPNPYLTASQFWATVELNKLHFGNAYVWIETNEKGFIKNLWQLPSRNMEVWVDDKGIFESDEGIWYVWTDVRTGKRYRFCKDEILHFKTSFSFDGLVGMPVREILKTQINTNKHAEAFLNKFYQSGMYGSKLLVHYTGQMDSASENALVEEIERFTAKTSNGKIMPLPLGFQAVVLDMKLADAQFFENNKVTALQIAGAFGIKPNVINDYSKSSYSNSESQQLDFYVNTLQPLFKSYEQEMTSKLLRSDEQENGMRLNINEKILFKMDSKTQSEVITTYLNNFAMTVNEAREELDLPYISEEKGGNKLIGNGNAITLDKAGCNIKREKRGCKMKDFKVLKARAKADNVIEVDIYGDIIATESEQTSYEDVTPLYIKDFLAFAGNRELEININSLGGDVNAGIAIYNMLKNYKNTKRVYIQGIAGSISSVVAMAGDEIYMADNAQLMIHRAWCIQVGNAQEMQKAVDFLNKLDGIIADVYMTKITKKDVTRYDILNMMSDETWLTGVEASKIFDIKLSGAQQVYAKAGDISRLKKMPDSVKAMLLNEQKEKEKQLEIEKEKLNLLLLTKGA